MDSYNAMREFKIGVVLAFISISAGTLGSHATSSLWPWIPVSVAVAILVILASVLWRPNQELLSPSPILAFTTAIAVFYRGYIFTFPASLIGMDPDRYAVWINQLIAAGSVEAMSVGFYQRAPLFHLVNGIFSILSGLPVREAMVVNPIMVGVTIPISVYILSRYLPKSSAKSGLIATLIIVVGAQTVKLSYWPVAQTLATVFLIVLLIVSIRLIYHPRDGEVFSVLFLLFLLTLSLTHKLPVLITTLIIGIFASTAILPPSITQRLKINYTNPQTIWLLFVLTSVILFVQWIHITGFISSVVIKIVTIFISGSAESATVSPTRMNPTTAVKPYTPIVGILLRNLHSLVLLVMGAIAWLILAYTERDSPAVQALLIAAGVLFMFFPITLLVPTDLIYTRIEVFIEPIMAVLIAAALIKHIDRSRYSFGRVLKVISVGIIVFIISAQIVTVGAAPDFPGTTQMYLTQEEVTAKEFGYQYLNNSTAGPYYAQEKPFPDRHVTASGELKTERMNTYAPLNESLYNASLLSNCPPNILSRSTDVYLFHGSWRITWNLQSTLDKFYDRVYSSGGAKHYVRPSCT